MFMDKEAIKSMDDEPTFVKRQALVIFFAMAYLLSWMWVPVAAFLDGPLLFPIGPLVAALSMVTATGTWRELLGRVFRWRVPIVWYAAAILVPAAMSLAALSTTVVIGGDESWPLLIAPLAGAFLFTWIFNNTNGSVLPERVLHASSDAAGAFADPMYSGSAAAVHQV
jgi:hypothetical protein